MRTIVAGAGAAGLIAAGTIKNSEVILIERNEKVGKKIYITGKGRCNVTNDCSPKEFLEKVVNNPKFLTSSIYGFSPENTIELLNSLGVKTKTERGNRVFPQSDKSSDVIKALKYYAEKNNVKFLFNTDVLSANKSGEKFIIKIATKEENGTIKKSELECDKLIITTGGKSYPQTGSNGDGYNLAKGFGHNIIKLKPALVPIILSENTKELEGLSLKNVSVSVVSKNFSKSEFGEMLFTADGVSGPTILTLSSYINNFNFNDVYLKIDLKPALREEQLDERILSDFDKYKNKQLKNALNDLLPKSLIPYIINYTKISSEIYINSITKPQRKLLVSALKELTFKISGLKDIEYGIITSGGVDTKEISPKTMESKLVSGLYFAGEIIDVDAVTGGFNIQIALSTGAAAGKSIGELK